MLIKLIYSRDTVEQIKEFLCLKYSVMSLVGEVALLLHLITVITVEPGVKVR